MTRKDYVLIAEAIRITMADWQDQWELQGRQSLRAVATQLAVALSNDNPAFKMDKFLEACGVN